MIDNYLRETGQADESPTTGAVMIPDPKKRPKPKEFVAPLFVTPATWVIPAWLESEANRGNNLRGVLQRKAGVKAAVWKSMARYYWAFGPVGDAIREGRPASITVTRLGGRGLDVGNLWRAVKPVEDAIAILLGCSDGSAAWQRSFYVRQEPGNLWGVRVEMRLPDEPPRPSSPSG
jgi:hypothetical protein